MRRCLVAISLALLLSVFAPADGISATGRTLSGLTDEPTPALDDLLLIQDVSDPSMDPTGTSNKVDVQSLIESGVTYHVQGGITTYNTNDSWWNPSGVTLTTDDLNKTFFIRATSPFNVWLPPTTTGDSNFMLEFNSNGVGGISIYPYDNTYFVGGNIAGASVWTLQGPDVGSGVSKLASVSLRVGTSGKTIYVVSVFPTFNDDPTSGVSWRNE